MEDTEIIALFRVRDQEALRASEEKYGGYCRSVAYGILRDEGLSQECVNDVWLSAWRSIPPEEPRHLGAYFGRLARNTAINRYKHDRARKRGGGQPQLALQELEECLPSLVSLEEGVEQSILTGCIEAWLRSLPQEKRRVFVRRYWYMSPVKEIAREYSMSETKVKSMLFRLRKELRAWLDKEGIEI